MSGPEVVAHFPDLQRFARACDKVETFRTEFGTEEACRRWFYRARWPQGFKCPICGGSGRPMNARRVIECRKCRRQTSLTAGTLLQGTKHPLKTWFAAAYLVVQRGVNAKTLQRELAITYKTAWTWAHKLRAAMKTKVVPENPGPKEQLELGASRTRNGCLQHPDPRRREPCGCTKLTRRDWMFPDEMEEEREASRLESEHRRGIRRPERLLPEDLPRGGSPVVAWHLLATFKGSLSEKHLRTYLDEYAWKENRRARPLVASFESLVRAAAVMQPHTYRRVVARPALAGHTLGIFKTQPPPKVRAGR